MLKIKKTLSLLLVLIIVLMSFLNSFMLTFSAEEIIYAYVTGTSVRVRSTPTTAKSDNIIETVSTRYVTYMGQVPDSGGGSKIWYQITYHNGTKQITGYVREDNIKITKYNPDATFEEKISAFPESYRESLRALKSSYPNWEFIPEYINSTFNEMVYQQSLNMRKQVNFTSHPVSWRSMGQGAYDWIKLQWVQTNGGWTGASREIIAYYMDPRNFLNASSVYQFLNQGYNSATQTEQGLAEVIKGTFLEKDYPSDASDPYAYLAADGSYKGSYKKIFIAAGQAANINPYIVASKIIQEQSETSSLISGTYSGADGIYYNYYNFFNIGASGSNESEVIINGLIRAKSEGWNTRAASIIGGAKFLSNNYVNSGQETYYFQDFNVKNPDKLNHQYAQAVHDAYSKGKNLADTYKDKYDCALDFIIPIFLEMPQEVCAAPQKNSYKNNYYATSISVLGNSLTPSFSMYNYNYDLHVSGDSVVYVTPAEGAAMSTASEFSLSAGNNTVYIGIKSETGYLNYYQLNIQADVSCKLSVVSTNSPPAGSTVMKGDTNGDGKISLSDLANVRLHLLGLFNLSGNNLTAADTNVDGKISLSDLANIRLHLLGLFTIS